MVYSIPFDHKQCVSVHVAVEKCIASAALAMDVLCIPANSFVPSADVMTCMIASFAARDTYVAVSNADEFRENRIGFFYQRRKFG